MKSVVESGMKSCGAVYTSRWHRGRLRLPTPCLVWDSFPHRRRQYCAELTCAAALLRVRVSSVRFASAYDSGAGRSHCVLVTARVGGRPANLAFTLAIRLGTCFEIGSEMA